MKEIQEYKINEFITVKLEDSHINIYVNGEFFWHCKYLLISFSTKNISDLDEIDSIDEAAEVLDHSQEGVEFEENHQEISRIPPETEYWGHCSNLQAWAENNYDTRLMHSNLSFPLLKKLAEAGDPQASKIFKEEVAKRFESNFFPVQEFLLEEGYLDGFTDEELSAIGIEELEIEKFSFSARKRYRYPEGQEILEKFNINDTSILRYIRFKELSTFYDSNEAAEKEEREVLHYRIELYKDNEFHNTLEEGWVEISDINPILLDVFEEYKDKFSRWVNEDYNNKVFLDHPNYLPIIRVSPYFTEQDEIDFLTSPSSFTFLRDS